MIETKRILITVKTYPHPSDKYLEVVCTAGMLEDGSFIRLYPVDYRYMPRWQQYKKYQWIEVEVEKNEKDDRSESYRPNIETLRLCGKPVSAGNGWAARKAIVLRRSANSIEELRDMQETQGTSLGLVKPAEITDLVVTPDNETWKPKWYADMMQARMFGPKRKPLQKIPFKFQYRFRCTDPRCRGHTLMTADWEAAVLYLKEVESLGDREQAIRSVRAKFFDELCGPTKDTHFFVGTLNQYPTSWIVLGVFSPPRDPVQLLTVPVQARFDEV